VSQENVERLAAVMPPDGTDLTKVFAPESGFSAAGLIADEARIRFVTPNAEQATAGPDGFLGTWTDWLEPWETYTIHYDDVTDQGDVVIALVRLRGVTKRGGVEIEQEAAGVFTFANGQVVEIEFNLDREDALKD
jgi:ketosteroid isomerase-like protein